MKLSTVASFVTEDHSGMHFCFTLICLSFCYFFKELLCFLPRFKHNAVDHIIKVHNIMPSGSKLYRCLANPKSCKFETFQKSQVVFHFKVKHKEDYGGLVHACPQCDQTFNWNHKLQLHISQDHPVPGKVNPNTFECPECGKVSE